MGGNIEKGLGFLSMGESKHTYTDAQIASLHISNQTMFSISSNIIIDSRKQRLSQVLVHFPDLERQERGAVRLSKPSPQPFRPYLDHSQRWNHTLAWSQQYSRWRYRRLEAHEWNSGPYTRRRQGRQTWPCVHGGAISIER